MRIGNVSGIHIAFLSFALIFLTAPLTLYVGRKFDLPPDWLAVAGRITQLGMLAVAIVVIDRIKPDLLSSLLRPIPSSRRTEVALWGCAETLFPFALFGALMLMHFMIGGAAAVERRFPTEAIHAIDQARAFSAAGLLLLFAAVAIAPIVEEIVFRGFLYNAWERSWGWIPSMILTSGVFALYHHNFASAFVFSILMVCIYRRTGTLIGPILVHAIHNLSSWYPLGGQFYIPTPTLPAGDIATWSTHLAILTGYTLAFATYVVMARHSLIGSSNEAPLPR